MNFLQKNSLRQESLRSHHGATLQVPSLRLKSLRSHHGATLQAHSLTSYLSPLTSYLCKQLLNLG